VIYYLITGFRLKNMNECTQTAMDRQVRSEEVKAAITKY
jgi:hypothetical protein